MCAHFSNTLRRKECSEILNHGEHTAGQRPLIVWMSGNISQAPLTPRHGCVENRQILHQNDLKAPRIPERWGKRINMVETFAPSERRRIDAASGEKWRSCRVMYAKHLSAGEISTSISSPPSHRGFFTPPAGTYAARSYESGETHTARSANCVEK